MRKVALLLLLATIAPASPYVLVTWRNSYIHSDNTQSAALSCEVIPSNVGQPRWHVPPHLSDRATTITAQNGGNVIMLEIKPLRAGDKENLTCSVTADDGATYAGWGLLNVTVLPHFEDLHNLTIDHQILTAGSPGNIHCPAYFGDPEVKNVTWWKIKDGVEVDTNRSVVTGSRGTELHIPTVQLSDAGKYRCILPNPYPIDDDQLPDPRDIYLCVAVPAMFEKEAVYLTTSVGETEIISCQPIVDTLKNCTNLTRSWMTRDASGVGTKELTNGSLDGRILISADGEMLQISGITMNDFSTQFVCVVSSSAGNATQTTTLLYREKFSVCVMGEENTRKITETLQDYLDFISKEDSDYIVDITSITFTRIRKEGHGVYTVEGVVKSRKPVIRRLNSTLGRDGGRVITSGLTVTLECGGEPDDHEATQTPEFEIKAVVVVAEVGAVVVVVVVIAAIAFRIRSRHRNSRIHNMEEDRPAQLLAAVQPLTPAFQPPTHTPATQPLAQPLAPGPTSTPPSSPGHTSPPPYSSTLSPPIHGRPHHTGGTPQESLSRL